MCTFMSHDRIVRQHGKGYKKKKGKGAEKTALKTEKKLTSKLKKQLAVHGEENIEDRRKWNLLLIDVISLFPLILKNPEIILFGGEFYNGKTNILNNDLLIYNTKRREWTQIKSPGGPPPRCAHQAVLNPTAGGQLWVFGGEFTNPSETQFYHYKDLWCFHFSSKRWEKISAAGGPSARSGHRMILFKRYLVVFGGFHDNLRECKYFNDVYIFDLSTYKWSKIDVGGTKVPDPRSACNLFLSSDGKGVVLFGGFCKEKKKGKKKDGDDEVGRTFTDMHMIVPDKHDESFTKWRWHSVKQIGYRPTPRTGMSCAMGLSGVKNYFFGGVLDKDLEEENESEDEEDEGASATFFNELFSVSVENERAVWHSVEVIGKRDKVKIKSKDDNEKEAGQCDTKKDVEMTEEKEKEPATVTVESGAFTITSTKSNVFTPSPRYGSGLVVKQGLLYLYGGVVEDSKSRQITLRDFYTLDLRKLEEWETIIESDYSSMEWVESESEEEDDDSDEESDEMDTDGYHPSSSFTPCFGILGIHISTIKNLISESLFSESNYNQMHILYSTSLYTCFKSKVNIIANEQHTIAPFIILKVKRMDSASYKRQRKGSVIISKERKVSNPLLVITSAYDESLLKYQSQESASNNLPEADIVLIELNYYYGLAKRQLIKYQSPFTGLFPATSTTKNIGSVKESIYCAMSIWSLHIAYRNLDFDKGKGTELRGHVVNCLRVISSGAYRIPDYGVWERGSKFNDGTRELHASSIGMAKAALESINGFNLMGINGTSRTVIYSDIDAHNRNRNTYEAILPRESDSRKTKDRIMNCLEGKFGFIRFYRDGYLTENESDFLLPNEQYPPGTIQEFQGVEAQWPIFFIFFIIEGIFKKNEKQIEKYQLLLRDRIIYESHDDNQDPYLPAAYVVPTLLIEEEKKSSWDAKSNPK
ncbi:Probable phosphorylase b kinase regulatory subunit beta,Phosphorylase b kinase regulatory subunit beta [Lepeophtheirus salmonis]|uniref:Probable phosphorylase b kinase regulatory subunit beta,Phosphorylase b kinase regulatory subunit beta n=1 Tax=Lepeophtheirus salmonis TaxID=72036 RepID=A0A7R8H5R5_LEPSM|nr:Probable phosphorylase b kinase regulatory subunit beta,Phosphorylase b kinase regulatory subunit beta [Lepeophtheirus salmonis]CAF2885649.1 Probable phosphorylase b kinase regulatory subunit beta,Phosphorylase b kinase regulatory subunit beta [Lepeophtheirus salmonis]